jgi:CubicO group peptidase (beta-lactamase class C family)
MIQINFKNVLIHCAFFWIAISCTTQEKPDDDVRKTIREQVSLRIDNKFSVGTVVAFLEDGKVEYFVYGFSDTTNTVPISQKSVFEIGSISKTFTSLLMADLIKKGKLKPDDPIENYLPDSVKIPRPDGHKITFADLATHTSALPRMPDNFNPKDSTNPYVDYSVKNMYHFFKIYQFKNPELKMNYSNLGVALLAHTLTQITGKPYEKMLQETICEPLKMKETSTLNNSKFLTTGHAGNTPVAHWDMDVFAGAGAIRSNAEDMMQYMKAQMGMVSTKLNPAIDLTQKPLRDVSPGMKIGMGWFIRKVNQDEVITHSGGTGGYRSFAGFCRKTQRAIVILNNSTQSEDDLGMRFFNPKATIMPVKKEIRLSNQILQTYTGNYKIKNGTELVKAGKEFDVILQKDVLMVRLTGEKFTAIYPESESKFFCREVEASVLFSKNLDGKISRITLYLSGQQVSAEKQ